MTDLSQSFNKFIGSVYETILGCLCERLADGRYKWRDTIGTREQIEKAIMDAGENLKNSLNKQQ